MVVLSGVKAAAPPARTVTVDIARLAGPSRRRWWSGEGSVVELKNSDRVPHDLAIPEMANLMPLERLAPGALRRQKLLAAGGYAIRDAEFPHLVISVIVVNSPFFATVDDKGAFKLPDAPEGKATLKVWSHGRWVHEQEIDVGPSRTTCASRSPSPSRPRGPRTKKARSSVFLSKIWFVLVGLVAGVATTAAFVAPRSADRRIAELEGQRLDRAQYAAEQMLKADAHNWIDYTAKLGRDAILAESLDSASRGAGEAAPADRDGARPA